MQLAFVQFGAHHQKQDLHIIDNEKTVAEGQLLRVHNDSDSNDQVNTSLDMSTSSFAKKRREQRKKHTVEHTINLQTLNFLNKQGCFAVMK